jgi:4-amino-4-deoxy-L-arabinose transferase-like glycosyltransferase
MAIESVDSADREFRRIGSLALLTILFLLPFSDKAFHIDDPVYVWVAQQIHRNPLDFYGFEIYWQGAVCPVWAFNKNPPGTSYFIALAASLVGWSERALHLAFLVPAVGAIVGTYLLAKRMCPYPFTAALTVLVTPVFLISSTQLMCDTLLLCFWVWGVVLWIDGLEQSRIVSLVAAGTVMAVACLIKYPGINLVLLLFAYSLCYRRSIGWWMAPLVIPIAALAAYDLYTASLYGNGNFTTAMHVGASALERTTFVNGLTALVFLGGCVSPVLFYLPWLCSGRQLLAIGLVLILVVGGVPLLGSHRGLDLKTEEGVVWLASIPIGVFACAGGLILGLATENLWKSRDSQALLLWLWIFGVFAFAGFVNWTINGRSILPLVPAASILLMRRIGNVRGLFTFNKAHSRVLAVLPAAAFAMMPTYGDYRLANSARTAARELKKIYSTETQQLWFRGHWGFQWYIQSEGAIPAGPRVASLQRGGPLVRRDRASPLLRSGDVLILPENNPHVTGLLILPAKKSEVDIPLPIVAGDRLHPAPLGQAGPLLLVGETRVHTFPVSRFTTTSRKNGAGFYSNYWGPLPYAFGRARPELYYAVRFR